MVPYAVVNRAERMVPVSVVVNPLACHSFMRERQILVCFGRILVSPFAEYFVNDVEVDVGIHSCS